MKKQSLITGTLTLGIAGILAKLLGFFFRWPIIQKIGDEGMGYYQMVYPLLTIFFAAASGIPIAISKMVSEKNAMGDKTSVHIILTKSLLLMSIIGGAFSGFLFLFARDLVEFFAWDPKSYYSIIAIAFAPIVVALIGVFRGFFQGFQNMTPTAVSEIVEQIGRVIVGVGLVYLLFPKGIEISAAGAAFGSSVGGVFALIYLGLKYIRVKKSLGIKKGGKDKHILRKLLLVAAPISIGSSVASIAGFIDSALIPKLLIESGFTYHKATIALGQLGKVSVLTHIPLTVAVALSASIVPIISSEYVMNKKFSVMKKAEQAISISMAIAFPCFLGLFFMADPVLNLLFPGRAEGYMILKYLSIAIPFMVLTQISTAILQSTGKLYKPLINSIIGVAVKIILTFVLVQVPSLHIFGGIIGTILCYIITSILNLKVLIKDLDIKFSINNSIIKPGYASVIMIIPVVFVHLKLLQISSSELIATVPAIAIGIIVYIIFIGVFGILDYADLASRKRARNSNLKLKK